MPKFRHIIQMILIIGLAIMSVSCASSKKNSYAAKRKSASKVNTSQLGRNRYYFSSGYQKKLSSSY